jgi:4-hydroxymandelate oxidase
MALTRRELLRSSGLLAGGAVLGAQAQAAESPAAGAAPTAAPLIVDVSDYERLAPERMSKMAWEYISAGAGDELTLRWNREAYERLRLRPRVLVDISKLDTRVTLLGREHRVPLLLAPTAYHKLAHAEGEIATAKGAAAADVTMVVSTSATTSLEDVAAAAKAPLWFQLYVNPSRDYSRDLIRRAEAARYEALVITVDQQVLGTRSRETRSRFTLPPGMERANLKGLEIATGAQRPNESTIYSRLLDPSLTWKEIVALRDTTKMPMILKGIMTGDDAAQAVDAGAAAIIVSNHGGRVLDTVPATIEALPEVVARVGGRVPVLVDGGIRRGTDMLKALALGASAVLIGRPYLYGLAVGGADGVAKVINLLRREFEMAMALTGRTSLKAIDASVIWR